MEQLHILVFGDHDLKTKLEPFFPSMDTTNDESVFLDILTYQPINAIIFGHDNVFLSLNLLKRIRIIKKHILAILIAPNTGSDIMLPAIRLGLTDYLVQPLHPEDVKDMQQRLVSAFIGQTRILRQNLLLNQYKNALDASLIITKTNLAGQITYVNEKMIEISGYSANEIIGQTHRLFKHPNTSMDQMRELWSTILAKRVWHGTIVNQNKNGKPFYTDTFILPLLNERNEISEYMDMRIDVTSLHLQKQYTQALLDAQSAMIIVFSETQLVQCNLTFLEFYGFSELQEFLHSYNNVWDIVIPMEGYANAEHIQSWIDSDAKITNTKIALHNKEHQIQIFEASKTVLETHDRQFHTIITLTDITEMENYLQILQLKIDEATQEIREQQQQLIAQSRAAALGEMFDNIAHQWRQPIGAINNAIINAEFAMELEGGLSNEELLQTFEHINTYTAFLSKTIDDFRNFSNPDKAHSAFSLHETIAKTIDIIRSAYEMYDIQLIYEPSSALTDIKVFGPTGELSHVILNLLSNAKDAFQEHKRADAKVRLELSADEHIISLKVSDNAGGIPSSVLPKIFDPYFTTKHKSQGTGLGLYMSKIIIEKNYGGNLEAFNTEEGAVFSITLPRHREG